MVDRGEPTTTAIVLNLTVPVIKLPQSGDRETISIFTTDALRVMQEIHKQWLVINKHKRTLRPCAVFLDSIVANLLTRQFPINNLLSC